jgi:hypothetical protein
MFLKHLRSKEDARERASANVNADSAHARTPMARLHQFMDTVRVPDLDFPPNYGATGVFNAQAMRERQ